MEKDEENKNYYNYVSENNLFYISLIFLFISPLITNIILFYLMFSLKHNIKNNFFQELFNSKRYLKSLILIIINSLLLGIFIIPGFIYALICLNFFITRHSVILKHQNFFLKFNNFLDAFLFITVIFFPACLTFIFIVAISKKRGNYCDVNVQIGVLASALLSFVFYIPGYYMFIFLGCAGCCDKLRSLKKRNNSWETDNEVLKTNLL